MSLQVLRRTPSKIVFDTGEWFDPSKAKSFPDDKANEASGPSTFTTKSTLWCTENGQWFCQEVNTFTVGTGSSKTYESWKKLKLKEAAARLIVNGYEEPEGIDYDYLKV